MKARRKMVAVNLCCCHGWAGFLASTIAAPLIVAFFHCHISGWYAAAVNLGGCAVFSPFATLDFMTA